MLGLTVSAVTFNSIRVELGGSQGVIRRVSTHKPDCVRDLFYARSVAIHEP